MQTNLRIKSISNADGKSTVTDNITYVNPNLSDANAKLLAMKINALTLNAYDTTERIDTRDLDSDSKLDYSTSISTTKLNTSTGTNDFGAIADDVTSVNLNVTPLASGGTINVRLRNLTQFINPYYTEITVNSAEGTVENRMIGYCTDSFQTTNMRLLWTMDLTLIGTFAAGDSITVKIKVNEDSTHNAWERTLTYNLIEWTSGGEG